jgi:rhodanese-related sulfurtransferase
MRRIPFAWSGLFYRTPLKYILWFFIRAHTIARGVPLRWVSEITPHLFVGGRISRAGWRRLETWGVSVLVNLRVELDDRELGIAPHTYLWLPTIDGTPPTVEQLAEAAQVIGEAIAAGRKVYVHCTAGVGRAPTAAAAYLVSTGLSPVEAVDFLKQHRPIVQMSRWQRERLDAFASRYARSAATARQKTPNAAQ